MSIYALQSLLSCKTQNICIFITRWYASVVYAIVVWLSFVCPSIASQYCHKCSAVAEMGDCLATADMGRKFGVCAPLGELGPHLTECGLTRGHQVHLDTSSRLATIDMGRKVGGLLCPLWGGESGSQFPSNTVWPGPRLTCMPSFILIHPTVWPQYTNVTDRRNGLIA